MKRKLLKWSAWIALAALAVVVMVPSYRLTIVGLARGERSHSKRPMSYWVYQLKYGDENERQQVADALVALGPDVVPPLLDVFQSGTISRARLAAEVLCRIGPTVGPEAIRTLTQSFRDRWDYGHQPVTAKMLSQLGPDALPTVLAMLDDPDRQVCSRTASELGEWASAAEPAVAKLVALLERDRADKHDVATSARRSLRKIGKPAVPGLLRLMKSNDPVLRGWAMNDLGEIGPEAAAAVTALTRGLDDSMTILRVIAADSLVKIDPAQIERALPRLREGLGERDFVGSPSRAAEALSRIGAAAVPLLLDVLKTGRSSARSDAAEALGNISPVPVAAIPALVKALQDPDWHVRFGTVNGVKGFGPAAVPAVPALVTIMKDGDVDIRAATARAIQRIGPAARDAVPVLMEALKDQNESVRWESAKALGMIGPEARVAAPALKPLLTEDRSHRAAAALGLWQIADEKEPLLQSLRNDDSGTLDALVRIAPQADWVVPALADELRQRWGDDKLEVAKALAALGPAAKPAVAALQEAVRKDSSHRKELLECLARIDPEAAIESHDHAFLIGAIVLVLGGVIVSWGIRRRRKSGRSGRNPPAGPLEGGNRDTAGAVT